MQSWHIQDAKARFSEFLNACIKDGPQLVTKRGVEAAVLVPIDTWNRLQKQLLLSKQARGDMLIPERGKTKRRNTRMF